MSLVVIPDQVAQAGGVVAVDSTGEPSANPAAGRPFSVGGITVIKGPRPSADITHSAWGGNRTGSASNTTPFTNAANSVIADGGGTVELPAGVYRFDSVATLSGLAVPLRVKGAGKGATLIQKNVGDWPFKFSGTYGAKNNISADATMGTDTVTMADSSVTGLAVGDIFRIGSGKVVYNDGNGNINYIGQLHQVIAITSTTITTKDAMYTDFLVSDTAWVQKVTVAPNIIFEDVSFEDLDQSTGGSGGFVSIVAAKDAIVDVNGRYSHHAGIYLENVYGFHVRTKAEDYFDDTSNSQYGYGVAPYAASCHGEIDVQMSKGRHAFTTGNFNDWGEPQNIRVTGVAHGCTADPFDTHPVGYNILFADCVSEGGRHAGFMIRCPHASIVGGSVAQQPLGIWLEGRANHFLADGVTVRDTNLDSNGGIVGSPGIAVWLKPSGTDTLADITIQNGKFVNIQRGAVEAYTNVSSVVIQGNHFHDLIMQVGTTIRGAVYVSGATKVHALRNTYTDDTGSTNNKFMMYVVSGGTGSSFDGNATPDGIASIYDPGNVVAKGRHFSSPGANTPIMYQGNVSGAVTVDARLGEIQELTLTGNVTGVTIANPSAAQILRLAWIQDATGGRTFVPPANVVFAGDTAPVLTATAGKRDIWTLYYDGATSKWFATSVVQNL